MQGYSKGSVGPSILVLYKGYLDASMQGYNKGSMGRSITVHYNG
jgi:hypothetical protein